jgi:hypothetical protein
MSTAPKITKDDLEARFRAVQGELTSTVENQKQNLVVAGVVGGVVLLVLFFVLGRRSGKKKSALIQIRRV